MIRSLSIWAGVIAFIATWPQWRRERHAPKPTAAALRVQYAAACRRHHGQREAWLRLHAAMNEQLKREVEGMRPC
jgi:hypothetical protein